MTSTILPPRGAWVERDILYNPGLPATSGWFYAQLRGLAWQKKGHATPWLSMAELEEITGRKHTAVRGYMTSLRNMNALRWQTSGEGRFMFSFPLEKKSEIPEMPDSSSLEDISHEDKYSLGGIEKSGNPETRTGIKVPVTPAEASKHPDIVVYRLVCGRLPGIKQYKAVIDTIRLIGSTKDLIPEAMAEYLKPYWIAWSSRIRQDGMPYDPASLVWLTDWAVNEFIPPKPTSASTKQRQLDIIDQVVARIG